MKPMKPSATDPRADLPLDTLEEANRRASPQITMASAFTPSMALGVMGVGLLGVITFTSLANGRTEAAQAPAALAQPAKIIPVGPPTPPPVLVKPFAPMPPPVLVTAPQTLQGTPNAQVSAFGARLRAPAIVVDLTKTAALLAVTDTKAGDKPGMKGSAEEQFSDRISEQENRPARAVRMTNSSDTVPQGAVIAGVLETAINSDLPGYVRAVVSRDVKGFDGRKILIPRGSRLIGQYRSGLAAGQSRAFIVWTRLMRPDGVTVQLGSPVTDPLGRAGLGGKVDSHFLKRFGSAILLSVVEAGLGRLQNNGADVIVRSAEDAKSVASTTLERDINIPPTVKVPQGAPIRIFLARDLDFSGTGGVAAP